MNWLNAVPALLVAVAWVLVPGLLVSYLVGLRGIAAWGLAPIAGIAMIASAAVAAGKLGIPWSARTALLACAVFVIVVAAIALPLRRRTIFASAPDPRRLTVVAAVGMLPAVVLGLTTVVQSLGAPDALSQTYDAVFHYNALAYIADSHNASPLTLSSLGTPDVTGGFYPAAWHDLASLVMLSVGASIPVAANAVTAAAAIVLWPLSCLLLVRQLFGRHTGALAITGVLSVGFTAFPWDLLGFGVLWPNLLGMALAPAALAAVFTVTGWTRDDAIGTGRGWLALVVTLVAAGFAHPNVLFSIAALSVIPIVARFAVRAWRLRGEGHTARGVIELVVVLVVLGGVWYWVATASVFDGTRHTHWPPFETPANAVGDAALNATNKAAALWLLSLVVLLGFAASRRFSPLRLVVAGHLVTVALYVLAAAINTPDTQKFTGYWYNDSHRLAAMLPITGVPLAVGGIVFLTVKIIEWTPARAERPRWFARIAPIAIVLTVLLVVATGGLYPTERYHRVAVGYGASGKQPVVTNDMRKFYARIADEIPKDAVVVGNPFEGAAMLWALEDHKVLFPHFRLSYTPDQDYIANHLDDASTDPRVCRAVNDLHANYLLIGGTQFRTTDKKWKYYAGLADPIGEPGFELVDSSGPSKLYRISACDAANRPAG